jgi:hypothetical protein
MNIDAKTNDLIDLLGFAPDSLSALAVKTALISARNEALEEAAKVIQGLPLGAAYTVSEAAAAIRSLKEGT